jgi:hypothetical protein
MRILAVLLVGLLCVSLLDSGCTKSTPTQVDTVTIRDTTIRRDTTIKLDTVKFGPAYIRFIAFLQNGEAITLNTGQGSTQYPFATANYYSERRFTPIRSDTSLTLNCVYVDVNNKSAQSIFLIPNTFPQALVTVAMFELPSAGGLNETLSLDTAIENPPPPGFAYFRLINGVSDYPNPPSVNVFEDSLAGPPLFRDPISHLRKDAKYQDIANYILIPADNRNHLFYAAGKSGFTPWFTNFTITSGGYYTGRLYGSKAAGTDGFRIDQE